MELNAGALPGQLARSRRALRGIFPGGRSLRRTLEAHFDGDVTELPVVGDEYPHFEHVNVQAALDAWLQESGRPHRLFGLLGPEQMFMSLADLGHEPYWHGTRLGAVSYTALANGPDSTRLCVRVGLYVVEGEPPLAILVRGAEDYGPRSNLALEVVAEDRRQAERTLAQVRRLSVERSVFRGQVLSFAGSPFGDPAAGPLTFHARPRTTREEVILPESTFAAIEEHVFGIAAHRRRLLASGQYLKRGLLLHGPPGTGKTLTTRYLVSRLTDHTVVILTGAGLVYLEAAAALARSLPPALVVLEDVDLIAMERVPEVDAPAPVLFELLNVMDGLDADADIVFLLTTNRADVLEPALAARPGRVDQAVEIALPDAEARRRLLALYGQGVDLQIRDLDAVVARTEGVTASFIKELVRKAALVAADAGAGDGRLTVRDGDMASALDALLETGAGLTRALLGIPRGRDEEEADVELPSSAAGWFAYAPLGRRPRARPRGF